MPWATISSFPGIPRWRSTAPFRSPPWAFVALTLFAALLAVLQMALVIVLRAHWTLDVLAGLFAALMVGAVFWRH
jgi:hypothetical protein